MAVLDQRDVQKLGGRARLYPSSYVVVTMLERHGLFGNVLDVTYGRGRFYYYRRPKLLVGADPRVWDWVVRPDIFIPRPVWALKPVLSMMNIGFDVLVCDPPWRASSKYNKREEYSFILGTPKLIIEKSFELARELGIRYVLLHLDRLLDKPVVEDVEFRYVARYLNNPGMRRTTHFTLYEVR